MKNEKGKKWKNLKKKKMEREAFSLLSFDRIKILKNTLRNEY